ncbi:MAG: hypothetical protein AAF288_09195 [Planctomycetota bacterium]
MARRPPPKNRPIAWPNQPAAAQPAAPRRSADSPDIPQGLLVLLVGFAGAVLAAWLTTQAGVLPRSTRGFLLTPVAWAQAAPWLLWVWASAVGYGLLCRRRIGQSRWGTATTVGAGVLVWLWGAWVVGLTAGPDSWPALAFDAVGVAFAFGWALQQATSARSRAQILKSSNRFMRSTPWPWACVGAPIGVLAVAAACPPGALWRVEAYGYDALSYHLQLPAEWLARGRIEPLDHNVYSHLPSLLGGAYARLGAITGGMHNAIMPAQMFHATLVICAAWVASRAARLRFGKKASPWAAAILLATPWAVAVGSLAYSEGPVLLALALLLVLFATPYARTTLRHRAGLAGALVATATLAKPSALLLVGGPAVVLGFASLGWVRAVSSPAASRETSCRAAAAVGVGFLTALLVAAPWWGPRWLETGNPVFPLMTQTQGEGPLAPDDAGRWRRAHDPSAARGVSRADALWSRWLASPGYGAVPLHRAQPAGETPATNGSGASDITRFDGGPGMPLLMIAAVIGALRWSRRGPSQRAFALLLLVMLAVQAGLWLGVTHRQGRFMTASIPLAAVAATGLVCVAPRRQRVAGVLLATLVLTGVGVTIDAMAKQTRPLLDDAGQTFQPAPGFFVGSNHSGNQGFRLDRHPLDELGANRVLLLGGYGQLAYLRTPIVYASPFNEHPLAPMLGPAESSPQDPAEALRALGVTHVWVDYGELSRFQRTLGIDPRLAPDRIARAFAGWSTAYRAGAQVVYVVPGRPGRRRPGHGSAPEPVM